jgi:type II secretory pathway pseudopilin PulG
MPPARRAFTVVEIILALGILAVAMVLIARIGVNSLRERQRSANRQIAAEMAANVLEAARAISWDALNEKWAAEQRLPEEVTERLRQASLTVRVEPDKERPLVKRVTVEVAWVLPEGTTRTTRLAGLFSPRAFTKDGGKP